MNDNFQNIPQEGTPEYEDMMRKYYGDDYEIGYRVGFGKRLSAYLIDKVIYSLLTMFVFLSNNSFMALVSKNQGNLDVFNSDLLKSYSDVISDLLKSYSDVILEMTPLLTLIGFLYYSLEIFFAQSIGKMIIGIKIGNENRTKADLTQLLIRYFVKNADTVIGLIIVITSLKFLTSLQLFVTIIIFLGCFMVLARKRQALHDIPAKTAVFMKNAFKENNI